MSASIDPECSEKKEPTILMNLDPGELTKAKILEYLRGESQTDECKDLFKEYQVCLNKALKSKGIDTMIEEARKASPNNDNAKQSKH